MIYFLVATLIVLLTLALFAGVHHFALLAVPLGFLAASGYFLISGQEASAENSAQLFFITFVVIVFLFRSFRLLNWLRNFFEIGR